MNCSIKEIAKNKLGIDGAIGFTLISRSISAFGALGVVALIALCLTKDEQGYYYTFGSIVALQVFLELGLSGIITQFVAHEVVYLKLHDNQIEYSGSKEHLSRLSSILHFCLKVFGSLAALLFVALMISGFVFFSHFQNTEEEINWKLPWTILALATALLLLVNPILSFLEGLGKVKEVAQIRLIQQTVNLLTLATVLFCNGKLYALGCSALLSFIAIAFAILFTYKKQLLVFIFRHIGEERINYWKEIFPYQWKIALSWLSGYFIFQLFNPILFATEGAKVAGQMGMVLQILNGISSISMSWINTKVPLLSSFIAQKMYNELDAIFNKTLKQLSCINLLCILLFVIAVFVLNKFQLPLAARFLPPIYVGMLCIVTFANQFVFSWATYLRCHKQEPFLLNSIIMGILCALSTILLGKYFGLMGITIGYSVLSLIIGLPWGYMIFKNKKIEWHGNHNK